VNVGGGDRLAGGLAGLLKRVEVGRLALVLLFLVLVKRDGGQEGRLRPVVFRLGLGGRQ